MSRIRRKPVNGMRFPRMSLDGKTLLAEKILHYTYNELAKRRNFRLRAPLKWAGGKPYDIYRIQKGRRSKIHFLILAQKLIERKIDPALYLKIMANYGHFRQTKYLPNTSFLMSDKAFDIFKWLYPKEKRKYPKDEDFYEAVNRQSASPDIVLKAVRRSADIVEETEARLGCDRGTAAAIQTDNLSPWFLAIYTPYLKQGGLSVLELERKRKVRRCMQFLMRHRHLLGKAVALTHF